MTTSAARTTTTDPTDPTDVPRPPGGSEAIDRLLAAFAAGEAVDDRTLHPDVALDATLPNWRMHRQGVPAVADQLQAFFDVAGRFEDVRRRSLVDGELVEITFALTVDGEPHRVHQAHVLALADDGRIVRDTMWCGGRWSASLLAEMEAADA